MVRFNASKFGIPNGVQQIVHGKIYQQLLQPTGMLTIDGDVAFDPMHRIGVQLMIHIWL